MTISRDRLKVNAGEIAVTYSTKSLEAPSLVCKHAAAVLESSRRTVRQVDSFICSV
jgi:hypothetical protein